MSANSNLIKAKNEKNDEFYTQLSDIEKELENYKDYFRDKVIYCNCDNSNWSNFWIYFHKNFKKLKLRKLIATHYERETESSCSYYLGGNDEDISDKFTFPLKKNGDFRSDECIELLEQSDIIVSNPPFSLAREYISQLINYNKSFIIVGDLNWATCKELFEWFKNNSLWFGVNHIKEFIKPNGEIAKFGNKLWFTNLEHNKRHEFLPIDKEYNSELYPTYDNYNAINVDRIKDIPVYDGVMGVPCSFLDRYNPEQFEILGHTHSADKSKQVEEIRTSTKYRHRCRINGKEKYERILIRIKH